MAVGMERTDLRAAWVGGSAGPGDYSGMTVRVKDDAGASGWVTWRVPVFCNRDAGEEQGRGGTGRRAQRCRT